MKKPLKIEIIAVFLIIILISIPSFAYALTGEYIRMGQVFVIDKETYNQIKINVGVHAIDIEMGEEYGFNAKSGAGLKNENGKTYNPEFSSLRYHECSDKKLDSNGFFKIDGKSPPINEITLCFSVEKKYKTFSLFHSGNQVIGSFTYDSNGEVTYDRESNTQTNPFESKGDSQGFDVGSFFSGLIDSIRSFFDSLIGNVSYNENSTHLIFSHNISI